MTDAGTRVVLVTGASSGIGLATAVQSAEASDHVVLLARGRSALESAAEKCRRAGAASVRVAAVDVLPGDWPALRKAHVEATIVKCAEMVGGSQVALEMAVEYAKQRIAFGRPIGSFQAIQHKCANMVTMVDSLRVLVHEAAWKLDDGQSGGLDVAICKDYAGDVFRTVTTEAHQIFAGLAYSQEHNLHLYFRHVKAADAMLGDSSHQQTLIAQHLAL